MQKKFKEGIDYSFIEIENVDVNALHILQGKYKDVVYCYGAVSVKEDNDAARLKFDYIVIDPGTYLIDDLTKDEEFVTMVGDILVEMIEVEEKNKKIE